MKTNKEKIRALGKEMLPKQVKGTTMNAIAQVTLKSESAAIRFFKKVKSRLLNVNRWTDIAGDSKAHFFLTDATGKRVDRNVREGDHIKIDIPGPGIKLGAGFDWVTIASISKAHTPDAEIISITARPSPNPLNNEPDTAHFLTSDATSTFQIKRLGKTVYAEEHARNEVVNAHTKYMLDNIRNVLVGWGAKIGFSYPQWKALVKGLVKH